MKNRLAIILFLSCVTAFGQKGSSNGGNGLLSWTLGIPDWLDWLSKLGDPPTPRNYAPAEVRFEWKCEGGVLVLYGSYATYPGVNGFDPNVGRNPTNIPCDPTESTDLSGNPAANANSASQTNSSQGSASQGSGPAPKWVRKSAGLATGASAPAAPYFTVPYRELGVIPFSPLKTLPATASCASALNPTAFAVDHLAAQVTVYNLCTSQPLATIPVISHPLQVRVTPDGSQAIVTSYDNGITFIDTATNKITGVLQPGIFASGLVISSDSSYALVTNYDNSAPYLAVVDIPNKTVLNRIPLDAAYPQSVFLNPDNTLAWVTYPWQNLVEAIDILTGTVTKSLPVQTPYDVAFSLTGSVAYIASGAGSVQVIDTATYLTTASVPAGLGACDLQVSPSGHLISVNNYLGNSTTIFDARSVPFSVTTPGGAFPHGVALVPIQ